MDLDHSLSRVSTAGVVHVHLKTYIILAVREAHHIEPYIY